MHCGCARSALIRVTWSLLFGSSVNSSSRVVNSSLLAVFATPGVRSGLADSFLVRESKSSPFYVHQKRATVSREWPLELAFAHPVASIPVCFISSFTAACLVTDQRSVENLAMTNCLFRRMLPSVLSRHGLIHQIAAFALETRDRYASARECVVPLETH
jgi:hypothetical protein